MDYPNHKALVVALAPGFDLTTHDGCGQFTEAVVAALHTLDPAWGHLKKYGGNQYHGHAVDAVLHKSGQAFDIIGNSASPKASPSWGIDKGADGQPKIRYADSAKYWYVLDDTPAPPPAIATHQYSGGGHDTGTCDACGQPRASALHAIPSSTRPHTYDGGEQDTGLCDVCGYERGAVLHQPVAPPVDPPVDPPAPDGGVTLETIDAKLDDIRMRQDRPRIPVPEDRDGSQ